MTGRRVRKWIYWAEHGAGMLPHCHGGLGDTNPRGSGSSYVKYSIIASPYIILVPQTESICGGWQKPIFSCTDPPWCGATCLNKTNKSGGPKDEADACCPLPWPRQRCYPWLSGENEWGQWVASPGPGDTDTCHTSGHSHTINQTKLIPIFKANPRSKAGTWVTAWLNPK